MKELNENELDQVSGGASFERYWRCTNPDCKFRDKSIFWTKSSIRKCPDCDAPMRECTYDEWKSKW